MKCDEFIIYKCKICGCEFAVKQDYIKYAELEHKYITCPLHGKHNQINVIGRIDFKKLMEERKAVEL